MMKASDAVAKLLSLNGVTVGFELIGGMITHIVDSINKQQEIKLLSMHHEQAAAFAAGGVARATNNRDIGLALGTSGPGATNLVTGIADCWLDNYPCVFITGQVNTYESKGERLIRQQGFQELDIVSLVKSVTKYAVYINSKEELLPEIQKAICLAKSGRPGPVLIDIPMNIQREDLNIDNAGLIDLFEKAKKSSECVDRNKDFSVLDNLLNKSKRPVFIVGGGAGIQENFSSWQKRVSELGFPHVSTLKGSEHASALPGYLGMLGAYGTRVANYAVQNADLVIVLGSRLDVRQTGANVDDFARNAHVIVQIDIDQAQLSNRVKCQVPILASCNDYFKYFLETNYTVDCFKWSQQLSAMFKDKFIDEYPEYEFSPFALVKTLSHSFKGKATHFVADVGNHQMWLAHSLMLDSQQKSHHSGGLGAMGFSLPTAIGIQLASNELVVSISGDGGIQLNIQELDILHREKLPILVIVLNNRSLGMVKNFQDMYFEGRNRPTYWDGYSSNFDSIAKAFGIESYKVSKDKIFREIVDSYVSEPRPLFIEVDLEGVTTCKPRLAFGRPIDEQYPCGDD